jgi:abhydrolase domain-containing protein 17
MGGVVTKILFQPPRPASYTTTPHFFWLYTKLQFKIPGFYISHNPSPDAVTLLFSHGNAEDLGMIYDWFREVARILNVNVMSYDYTGYGLSDGEPAEERVYADIDAAFDYLTQVVNLKPSQIILYGRSLGGGPSTYMAQKMSLLGTPVRGVVLQSPFLSTYRVAFHFRYSMIGDKFCNVDRMNDITCPVFIVHGTNDEVVPFWNGQELYLAVQEEFRYRPFWVKDAGHNNIELLMRDTAPVNSNSRMPGLFFERFDMFIRDTTARREYWEALDRRKRRELTFMGNGGIFSVASCCGVSDSNEDDAAADDDIIRNTTGETKESTTTPSLTSPNKVLDEKGNAIIDTNNDDTPTTHNNIVPGWR